MSDARARLSLARRSEVVVRGRTATLSKMAVLKTLLMLVLAVVISALRADARLLGRSMVEGTSMKRMGHHHRWAHAPAPSHKKGMGMGMGESNGDG